MTLLIIPEPQPYVLIVVHKIISTTPMLLVLKPLSVIFFTIRKSINPITLTLSFNIMPFISISILIKSLTFTMRFTGNHLSLVCTSVFRLA
ncbi:unknown [Prevotella sp. CAG:1124]|nr:unknown [Prevotella sp. CAG:1124]